MKVLSLFDGISCGRLALENVGIEIEKYYASEIEKTSIEATKKNRPDTIHLGDVREVTKDSISEIDLLIGGSPCTGFSFAGKQLNFNDPQSKLFFEFVRLKDELKPKYFFLENVKMKKVYEDVITQYMGVDPILINSSDFSAQNRQRLYWTNIPFEKDLTKSKYYNPTISVKDIIEKNKVDAKYYFSPGHIKQIIQEEIRKNKITKFKDHYKIHEIDFYLPSSIEDCKYEYTVNNILVAMTPRRIKLRGESARRFKPLDSKVYTLTTQDIHGILMNNIIRTLTPLEWERLQTMPDNWTIGFSDSRRYKMIGNAWTVSVISHIFEGLK